MDQLRVDEGHRSHGKTFHANLLNALPHCAKIGFTGTPILMGAKKRTHEIFGEFIDRYTLQQSEDDGSTVPILYEGRTTDAVVEDEGGLDRLFEDLFVDRTLEELVERLEGLDPELVARSGDELQTLPDEAAFLVRAHKFLGTLRELELQQFLDTLDLVLPRPVDLTDHIRQEIALVGFWSRTAAQKALRSWVVRRLDEENLLSWEELQPLANRILELAKANRHKLEAS